MPCYFNQIQHIFRSATVLVTPEEEWEIDRFLKDLLRFKGEDCPDFWKHLRPWVEHPTQREMIILALRDEFGQR